MKELNDHSIIKRMGLYTDLLKGIRFPLKSNVTVAEKIEKNRGSQDPQALLSANVLKKLYTELIDKIHELIEEKWDIIYHSQLSEELDEEGYFIPFDCDRRVGVELDLLIAECSYYDYCISVLNYPYNQNHWDILQNIAKYCSWIFPYQHTCIVSNRPTSLSFDDENNLHESNGKPAIEYADNFKVYAHHGVWLPEKYGKIPSSQWKSQWLLSEENAEIRRVLIQAIGYHRICEELGAIELDSYKEYTLLKIENYTETNSFSYQNNSEPMHLLKMTCPSTGFIHFLRTPPDITSARVAIAWVNGGIDPEEFTVQT